MPDLNNAVQNAGRDDQIREAVLQHLHEHGLVAHEKIEVAVHDASVKLDGVAANRYARARAEELAKEVEGVASVENHIHIQKTDEAAGGPILTTHMPGAGNEGSTQRP